MAFQLNLDLHETQKQVYNDAHRFIVLITGRQWGKSTFAARAGAGYSLTHDNSTGMIIAPYADQAHKDFQDIIKFIPEKYVLKISARWLTITLKNGSTINMKSAENLDGLRGFTLDWVIIDEAAYCSEEVWKIIQPELAIRKGRAWIISSPWTKGWLFDLYRMEDLDPKRYKSYHFTSTDSPFYDMEEAESYRTSHTELEYRTEILAEFLDGGAVFQNLEKVMISTPSEPIAGHQYIAGCDVASANDYTVIKIFDVADRREVHHVRLGDRSWQSIKTSIYMTCMKYNNAMLFIDQTGVGASVVEDLRSMTRGYEGSPVQGYLNMVPFIFTSKSKPELMSNYLLAMENLTIRLLPDQITKKEHESLEMKKSEGATGYIRYAAPKGRHDDCFTKGTRILTPLGEVPIEQLKVGDYVITRNGSKPIVATKNRIASVIDRYGLTGTPNHPIITPSGIVKLINITDTTLTYIWNPKLLCTEENRTGDTRIRNEGNSEYITGITELGKKDPAPYIISCGSTLTEMSQKDQSFTTKMVIPSTTPLKTSNVLRKTNTPLSIQEHQKKESNQAIDLKNLGSLERQDPPSQPSIGEAKNKKKMAERTQFISGTSQNSNMFVNNAEKRILVPTKKQSGVGKNVIENICENPEKAKNIAKSTKRKERVYNIQVAGSPEYFANGILVHNCVMSSALAVWGMDRYAGNQLAGPFTDNELNPLIKKQIDPSSQIDVEAMIAKMESRQIAGFGSDENQDICVNYD